MGRREGDVDDVCGRARGRRRCSGVVLFRRGTAVVGLRLRDLQIVTSAERACLVHGARGLVLAAGHARLG